MPETFPYRTKALFAFEEIDGVDVCFFGMHVQEYGSDCPFPNTRLVLVNIVCDYAAKILTSNVIMSEIDMFFFFLPVQAGIHIIP